LFKQHRDGDATEFDTNKERTPLEKYNVWIQQEGKDTKQCMKEYILLVA